ncbi:diguanylate cyclase [Pseudodesulfovibrio sp. zrk46]|uniref:diguanylate cyclase domain-containing protein n=1 Tax=Pseudodesulfovibrio sp. zrk46 TaxID=2725288 RepID=UPI00144985FB|nr:diguanylate cyclase [Pseudodesulfovibrio sp. zrk46]QJB57283.1 diguanylate cyclase [Pseudodesulfovibrio sp. zrk46]
MINEKPRILVVADADEISTPLVEKLSNDYHVEHVKEFDDVPLNTYTRLPDLILLAPLNHKKEGFDFCRRLKEDKHTQKVPVLFITNHSDDLDEAKGLELGISDYITTPFRWPLVLTRISNNIELKRRGDLLEELALLDRMTKLPNRQNFEKTITAEWFRGQRSQEALSLLICNLDEFKKYNDHFGYAMGNSCLHKVGKRLNKIASRASDLTARIGWEGFAIVLPATDKDGAMTLAESIRTNIEALRLPHAPTATREHITISLGVATMIPSRDSSPEVLFEEAAKALKEAKDTGRNQVVAAAEYKKLFG